MGSTYGYVRVSTKEQNEDRQMIMEFLKKHGIRFDEILFHMPTGERIVVNDRKPSGVNMAVAVNLDRDEFRMPEMIRKL